MNLKRTWFRIRAYFSRSGLLLILALFFGFSLGAAQVLLEPRIRANKLSETTNCIPRLLPGALRGEKQPDGKFLGLNNEGRACGWVVPVRADGFAGPIDLLLGLNSRQNRISGIYVLSLSETPGLGTRICDPEWLNQFIDSSGGDSLRLGQEIDGISGATISSRAVTDAVRNYMTREAANE